MTSERIQRQIEGLLDEAAEAVGRDDWATVRQRAETALRFDPQNADALAYLEAARRDVSSPAASPPRVPIHSPGDQPTSFAGGRYEVRRFLGEGGKKRVFLAHDTRLDRDVAFALIKTEGLDEVGRERIVREAQAMGRLGAHPHIVTIFEIGEEAGSPYVVNELLVGGDVEGELEKAGGPLPLARSLEIAKGVARGLAFAHERDIVHRDLKPGNVWLTSEGVAKIGDFGLAVSLDRSRLTQHGMMVGTVAYMPPEQALGGEVTTQADLYSLGAMLYELVTGRPPFQADDPTAVISQHINTPPVAPSWNSEHCPPELEALILKLLAKVPADRPASASEVLAALEAVDPNARSASHSDSSANPLDRLARGVFVGRERELDRLRAAFDDAFAGRGSVVMLVGEPGIGKTRTVQELSTYARMRGAKVLWGRAHEASGAPAYWPWTQAARDYRVQTPDDIRRRQYEPYAVDLQRILPNLRALFPGLPEPPPVDSEEGQFQLFDALTSFLRDASGETPLVIVLDDLHWADRSTLRMLTHLAREIGMARLLVVGTYRDTDLDRQHPLSQALAEMNREQLFTRVLLRGLTEAETRAYVEASAHVTPPTDLVRRIHQETEGNPFFLSEVVSLMAEEGSLAKDSLSGITIPEGVKEALGRRLDRLSPEANELLSVAAVVGRECSHSLLAALTEFDDDTLLRLVEEALAARVLEETGIPGEYRFIHALMQDALYAELSTARRVRMHARVGETLESLSGDSLDGRGAELARHFSEAAVMNPSLAEKAVQYLRLGGEQAMESAAYDDAVRHFERALATLKDLGSSIAVDEAAIWDALAQCRRRSLSGIPARVALDKAMTLYEQRGDVVAAARAAIGFFFIFHGMDESRREWPTFDRLIEALPAADSPELCGLLAIRAGHDFGPYGDALAARAVDMADALQLTGAAYPWRLRIREGQMLIDQGEFETSASMFAAIAHEVEGDSAHIVRSQQAHALLNAGRIDESIDLLQEHAAVSQRLRRTLQFANAVAAMARIAWERGQPDRYAELMRQAPPGTATNADLMAARVALDRAEFEEALALLPSDEHPNLHESARRHEAALRSTILLSIGQFDAARRELEVVERGWRTDATYGERRMHLSSAGDAMVALALASPIASGLVSEAAELLAGLPKLRCFVTNGIWAESADIVRGLIALRLGDVDAAEGHYRDGLEWARRPDVRFGLVEGRCLQGLADVAEARGDHALALEHLDSAAAKFAEYGAKLYLDQVLAKKEFLKA